MRFLNKINKDEVTQKVMEKDFLLALHSNSCDSVCYMLFGYELDSINDILNPKALTTRVIQSAAYFNRMMAPMDNGLMLWRYFPTPLYKKLKKSMDDVELIPKREVNSRILNESLANGPGILNNWIHEGCKDSKTMITLLSDLLLAGIDTTSYTLSFVLYNLSVNKRVQDKLYEELRLIDPDVKKRIPLSLETLARATYLKRVVKESMRLYPVSVGTSRVLEEPCVIAGYKIPENATVITMNQVTCRLDEYVDQANEFIPERYDSNSGFRKIRPFTTLPFGHGPRACIGRRIAESSMYLFLFRLMRSYEIEWVGSKPLGFVSHSLTEPDGPLLFRFVPREL
ncbi:Cytochrome P450, mitochondrial [Orchesella cincta]|uniref:Cytochrome P450, mitochondrial n=1 Tax=Orchesella cincta TaxID=48709 RepID=A0A1D2M6E0_ORCCI|nr:Cytochrome P450, mitochondrial [Orchesella cincta]